MQKWKHIPCKSKVDIQSPFLRSSRMLGNYVIWNVYDEFVHILEVHDGSKTSILLQDCKGSGIKATLLVDGKYWFNGLFDYQLLYLIK